jgi:hypothetical protein
MRCIYRRVLRIFPEQSRMRITMLFQVFWYLLIVTSVVSPQSRGTANSGLEVPSEAQLQLPFGKLRD